MESQLDLYPKVSITRHVSSAGGTIVAALVFLALTALLYAFSWNEVSVGFLSDDAVYLLMADAFSPFRPAEPELAAYVMRQALFPPLYPLLLAVLGAGSGSLLWAHLITTTTLVLSLVFYGLWINREIRDRVPTIGLVLIFALAPGTLLQSLEILSEFPYLMLTLIALWQAERARNTSKGYGLTALWIGLATLTRTAGLSLLVAFAVWLFRHRVRGRAKWLAVALVPSMAWLCFKRWVLANNGGYGSLWSSLWEPSQTNLSYVVSFLENQSKGLWQALLNTLAVGPSHLTQAILAVVLLVGLPVWIRRLWHWQLDAWYLLSGGAMILLYPFPGYFTRLFLPWVPIVLFYAYLGAMQLTARWGEISGKPALAYGFLGALFLTLIPSLGFIAARLAEPIPQELESWRHTRYWFRLQDMNKVREDVRFRQNLIHATGEVAQRVPKGECVYGVHTAISMLYSRRVFQQPPPAAVGDSEFEKLSGACDYFFLVPLAGQLGNHPVDAYYPRDRLPSDNFELIQAWQDPRDPNAPTALLLHSKTAP